MEVLNKIKTTNRGNFMDELHEIDGYIYATDGYICLRKKGKLKTRKASIGEVNRKAILSCFSTKTKESRILNSKEFILTLESLKHSPLYKVETLECEACSGLGSVDYDFEHNNTTYSTHSECPVCEGTCIEYREGLEVIGKTFSYDLSIELFKESILNPQFLYDLLLIGPEMKISNTDKSFLIGSIGDYDFVIMGMNIGGHADLRAI